MRENAIIHRRMVRGKAGVVSGADGKVTEQIVVIPVSIPTDKGGIDGIQGICLYAFGFFPPFSPK